MIYTQNQLRWQCRRGMLELDTLLLTFLTTEYPALTPAQQYAFRTLLQFDDIALWAMINNNDGIFAALSSVINFKESSNDRSY